MIKTTSSQMVTSTIEKNSFVVLKIGAIWCGPCKRLDPKLEKLALELKNQVTFLSIDTDTFDKPDYFQGCRGLPLPATLMFNSGTLVCSVVGGNIKKIREKLFDNRTGRKGDEGCAAE
jgi:thioredoxin 1